MAGDVEQEVLFSYRLFILTVWDLFKSSWRYTLLFSVLIDLWFMWLRSFWPTGHLGIMLWFKVVCLLAFWAFGMSFLLLLHAALVEQESWSRFVQQGYGRALVGHVVAPILYAFGVGIGFLVFVFPGLYVLFSAMYFPVQLHQKQQGPLASIRASMHLSTGYTLRAVRFFVALVFVFFLLQWPIVWLSPTPWVAQCITYVVQWVFISIALLVYWQHYQWMLYLEKGSD